MLSVNNYPADKLPAIAKALAFYVQEQTKAPIELIGASLLSAMAASCQDLADVEKPRGGISPISLYFITVAESGERKSTVDKLLIKPFKEFEQLHSEAKKNNLVDFAINKDLWNLQRQKLEKEFAKNGVSAELEYGLKDLHNSKPILKKSPSLLTQDFTPAALMQRLKDEWHALYLHSDEAGSLLSGHAASDLPILNSLWDGSEIRIDRKNRDSITLSGARLSAGLMLQPRGFQKFLGGQGSLARDNGFLARCLICAPISTQGSRFEYWNNFQTSDALENFHNRISELLLSIDESNLNKRRTLTFSESAISYWLSYSSWLEPMLGPNCYYESVRDAAAKIGEQVARLAAIFHLFTGQEGQIQRDTLDSAISICQWYLDEFCRMFSPSLQAPQFEKDSYSLLAFFTRYFQQTGHSEIKRSDLLKIGPNAVRQKARLDAALSFLQAQGKINIYQKHRNVTKWVSLNFFSNPYRNF